MAALLAVGAFAVGASAHTAASGASGRLTPDFVVAADAAVADTGARHPGVLRVCADPNNLPFTNDRLEGFENRIASLVAAELHDTVAYTWWAQRRGFFRNTLGADSCDLVVGVPAGFEMALTTRPYYRSSYAFVTRTDRKLDLRSLDDPRLTTLVVGVQMIGDDFSNTPPAHALSRRGIIANVRGYTVYGDYAQPNPPARIIDAVASGDIDVAIAWGPLAGYFAQHEPVPLTVTPVTPQMDGPVLPLAFSIAMGVGKEDTTLRDTLNAVIARRQADIDRILDAYGVPRVGPARP